MEKGKDFKFGDKVETNAEILLNEGKRVIHLINVAIAGRTDMSADEYAFAAANAITGQLGPRSKIEEPSYLVAEAIALAIGAQATRKGLLGALFETTMRLRIRGEMSKLEDEITR